MRNKISLHLYIYMVKISQELRENILIDLKNNVSLSDIMKKHNTSRATIYRLKKIIETESEETNNNISNNNI
jgi:transposase